MALDFPQQAQEPASSQGFFVPGRPLQQQPCDIPCNIPCNPADNISSNMNTPSLNSQHYCNPGYNTDFSIQPSVPLYQSFPLQSHGSYQQPPLTVESALAIMTNSVPSTNPGAYDFYIQPQGTPLMDNTTSPFQNYTPHDCLYLPAPTDRELLLLLQQQCMDVNSDSLVTDFAHTEEQRVTNILFTPPASPFLNSGEQMMPEPPKVSLAGRKRRGSDNHGQCGHKRPKKAIQIQKKLEIIKYWEQNQNVTFQKIGEYFGIPRTTIYGIVKVREELWAFDKNQPRASLTLETSRMVEPQLRILEEVLMTWITDLQSRCAPISGPKIIGQAFNIHRMLSGLLVEPLPPCKFTSGWLKNFKKRRHLSHKAMHREVTAPDEVERAFKEVRDEIAGYAINRIYTCGVTSMYLSTIPTAAFQNEGRNYQTNSVDSASVSVLFCSNADGSDKRKPLVLGRHSEAIFETEDHCSVVPDAGVEDMTAIFFRKWITDFNSTLDDGVVLLVDETVWRLFETESSRSREMIGKVKVIKAPLQLHSWLPMAAGITEELKVNYYVLLMERKKSVVAQSLDVATDVLLIEKKKSVVVQSLDVAIENYLRLISDAWSRVRESTFKRTFQKFIPDESRSCLSDESNITELALWQSMVTKLQVALRDVSPAIPESVLQYYLNQDNDMGPSDFLRAKIQEMHRHEDFGHCFVTPNFGVMRFGSGRPWSTWDTIKSLVIINKWVRRS